MAVRRLNHAVLYVDDLASAVDFYTATLGFEIRTEMGGRAAFLRAPGSANDHDLGLFEVDGARRSAGDAAPRTGLYHLAWEVGTLAELDEIAPAAGRARRPGGRQRPPGVQVPVREGPERHRVRGDVAGAGRGLGGRALAPAR